jgi:hypothetical protein
MSVVPSEAKAKRELGLILSYASWRQSLVTAHASTAPRIDVRLIALRD